MPSEKWEEVYFWYDVLMRVKGSLSFISSTFKNIISGFWENAFGDFTTVLVNLFFYCRYLVFLCRTRML